MPEPTDPAKRLGGDAPSETAPGGPPRHWLDYIRGRAPHLFTPEGDFGAGWWSHSAAHGPHVAPIAPPRSEPRVHEELATAPGDGRGPPRKLVAPETQRADPRIAPERDRPATPRGRKIVPATPAAERRARVDAPAPRTTPAAAARQAPVAPETRVATEPQRARRAPAPPTPAALRAAPASRTTFEVAAPRARAIAGPEQDARPARRPEPRGARDATHEAATQTATPAPSQEQWPPLPVAPIARARSRGIPEVRRPRAHEPTARESVIDSRDLWPSLPVVELAEPEPWRGLERERARGERIAHEQGGR